jgi:uncharacterized RDD family membrane protein YckC
MKPPSNALRAALLLAALIPFAAAAFAADPAKPQDNAAPAPEAPLHEIGANADAAPTPTPTPSPTADTRVYRPDTVINQFDDENHNRVSVGDSTYVGPDETIRGNAVAVMGPVKVDGTVDGNCVSVLGSNTINGTVHGNAVVVLGKLKLGPNAHVDGHVVAAVGIVSKEPGAYVGGNVVQQGGGLDFSDNSEAFSWWQHGFRKGRPLAFGPHLHLFWLLSICTIAFYILLSLVFPAGVTKCGETLVERPGITLLTGMLAVIGLPVVFVLLLITIVGIPVALVVLPIAIVACITFGKAAVYALIGRSILGKQSHPALAVLVGVAILVAFYLIPFVGGGLWVLMDFLGYACAVAALFTPRRGAPPAGAPPAGSATPAPAAPAPVPAPPMLAPLAVPGEPVAAAAPAPAPVPVPLSHASEAALPRAGFWIRMVAILIDVLLVGILTRMHDWFPVALATYAAILWKLRGATIGDIIFGLKVVRVDGGAMEWVTVIVRALACFFSVVVVGLGFIWIAFDREKQGWHDKIAGTVVVHLPKGSSLV